MSCCLQNLVINDLVSNHELSCHDLNFHHEVNHIIFCKEDKPLDILKTCYDNLDRIHLKVFRL